MNAIIKHLFIVTAACLAVMQCWAAEPLYKFGQKGIALHGRIEARLAFGPPGYGEDPENDARVMYWVLVLDTPITVHPGIENENLQTNVTAIQLNENEHPLKGLAFKLATVTGELSDARTGGDHTPVVLTIEKLSISKEENRGSPPQQKTPSGKPAANVGKQSSEK